EPLALDSRHGSGDRTLSRGRMVVAAVGLLPARDVWTACDVAGELGDAHLGLAALRNPRRLEEQLVGRAALGRRRMAQQPPRASGLGLPRNGLVRAGF